MKNITAPGIEMINKLNICIVSREYPPETLWGGIGTFTYNLAHGLNNIGHNVTIVSFTLAAEESIEDDCGIKVYRIASPKIPFRKITYWDYVTTNLTPFALVYSYCIYKKIESINELEKFDVIDFPEHIGEGFYSIFKNIQPSLVRLYTPLSLIGKIGLNVTTNRIDYRLIGILEKYSIKKATIVNSPSRALSELVQKEFKIHSEFEILYNPIDTDKFSPNGYKNPDATLNVLFVGGLTDRKGIHILTRAIPLVTDTVDNIKFTIIGSDAQGVDGFQSMKAFMLEFFEKMNVQEKIEMIDRVKYDELPYYYNQADISVVPSLYDNSPYTCLEAMSCGLPVIGTSAGGMPEYIDDEKSGIIVPPLDVRALSQAIIYLAKNSQIRKQFSIMAREKALKVFKRENVARKITSLYEKAIKKFNDENSINE